MAGGRPLKFATPELLQAKADEYFDITPIEEQCVTGLALHLETSRKTLCEYDGREEFSNTIKGIKDRIEHAYELRGLKRGNAFDIFALKNMDWSDRSQQELSTPEGRPFQTEEVTRPKLNKEEWLKLHGIGKNGAT